MNKKIRRWITALALSGVTLFASSAIIGNISANAFDSNDVSLNAAAVKTDYVLGEKLAVPQGTLTYKGEEYPADAVVHFPSGDAYLTDEITLTQTGKYIIEYRAVINGHLAKEYREFETLESLYSVSSGRSSITYGQPKELGINYTTEQSPKGLCVSLANGDKFTYNGVVDLNDSSKLNKAIQLYVTPENNKAADAFSLFVTFTDIYNPNNYAIVSAWSYNMKAYDDSPCRAAYVTTCIPSIGQSYTGHYTSYHASGAGWVNTVFKSMRTSGFCSFMSFYGNNANGDITWKSGTPGGSGFNVDWGYAGQNQFGLWWNYEQRQVCGTQPDIFATAVPNSEIIGDYDDPNYYSSLWDGFTTGECYVSVWAEDYNNTSFNFVVTEVDGNDLTKQEPERTYKDTAAPSVNVNYDNYTENSIPTAKVGCEYPVYNASAMDGYDGETSVSARAFYGYGTDKAYEITCGNTFIPDREGEYTIVYTSTDRAGNKATKLVTVTATNEANALTFSIDETSADKAGTRGLPVSVASANYSGGVGTLTYSAIATNTATGKQYDATSGTFRPMEAGKYSVTCTVKDFIGQSQFASYEVNVADTTAPVFHDVPVLNKYLISGYSYKFPQAFAIDEVTGATVEAKIFVEDDGETTEAVKGIYSTDGESRILNIIYRATNANGTTDYKVAVPMINVAKGTSIDLGKYFKTENITAVADNEKVLLSVNAGAIGGKAEYINPVLAEGFTSSFSIENGNFDVLNMYLTDSVNKNEVIKFTWKKTTGTSFLYVNDKLTTVSTTLDFAGVNASNFEWSNVNCAFTDYSTSLTATVDKTIDGMAFHGFTSGKVYVTYELAGASEGAALAVTKINNQTIRTTRRDVITPQVQFLGGEYVAQIDLGETLSLKDLVAADVLAPTVSVTLTVVDPEGKPVKTVEGTTLTASEELLGSIKFTKVGKYTLTYEISDDSKLLTEELVINCLRTKMLEITLDGNIVLEGSVGTTVSVPGATATDLYENKTVKCYIMVMDPRGVLTKLSEGTATSFIPNRVGTYKVMYVAYDAASNVEIQTYTVIIK